MEDLHNIDDRDLLVQLKDPATMQEAVKYLYRTQMESLNWFVMNNGGSWDDAQDIFQECIVTFIFLVKQSKFRGESSIKTFLFAITRNIWMNELKKRGRTVEREKKFEQLSQREDKSLEIMMDNRDASDQLMNTISGLGESCKKILILYYYEQKQYKEMVGMLQYENEQVIRNKKHKCLKKLEEQIKMNPRLSSQLKKLLYA